MKASIINLILSRHFNIGRTLVFYQFSCTLLRCYRLILAYLTNERQKLDTFLKKGHLWDDERISLSIIGQFVFNPPHAGNIGEIH